MARSKDTGNIEDDPMFGAVVRGSQAWHKHQQDIAHASAGVEDSDDDEKNK